MAIELDRRFVECREAEQSDPDLVARFGRTDGTLGWADLLARRRVCSWPRSAAVRPRRWLPVHSSKRTLGNRLSTPPWRT